VELANCITDLDNTRSLLLHQEKQNKDLKNQIEAMKLDFETVKQKLESHIENLACQLDSKSHLVSRLEGKLRDFLDRHPTNNDKPLFGGEPAEDAEEYLDLVHGQNLVELDVYKLELNATARQAIQQQQSENRSKSMDFSDPENHLTTFVSFDFFDFATQVGPMALGMKPEYNFLTRFKVMADDFFIEYLHKQSLLIEVHRSVGGDFWLVGTAKCQLKDLATNTDDKHRLRFLADVIGKDGYFLGKLSFSLRLVVPLQESIHAYRQRTEALAILGSTETESVTIQNSVDAKNTPTSRSEVTLPNYCQSKSVEIEFQNLQMSISKKPVSAVFLSFTTHKYGEFITDSSKIINKNNSVNLELGHCVVIPSIDLAFDVGIFGEVSDEDIVLLGKARISLKNNSSSKAEVPVELDGTVCGALTIMVKPVSSRVERAIEEIEHRDKVDVKSKERRDELLVNDQNNAPGSEIGPDLDKNSAKTKNKEQALDKDEIESSEPVTTETLETTGMNNVKKFLINFRAKVETRELVH
jgi:hypothetical protein